MPVIEPEAGVKISANAANAKIVVPNLGRTWIATAGARWTPDGGWQGISDTSVQDTFSNPDFSWGNTAAKLSVGPFVKFSTKMNFDVGKGWWSFNLASINFFSLTGERYWQFEINNPLDSKQATYQGPAIESGVKAGAGIEIGASLFNGLSKYLPIRLQTATFSYPVFSEQFVLYRTTKPTGSVACNPNCSNVPTNGSGTVTLTATSTDTTANGTVEFWASRDSASPLIQLGSAVPFVNGRGEASFVPDANTETGSYTVFPRLRLNGAEYAYTQLWPLASEQPIGAFSIGDSGCVEGQIIQVNGVDRYKVVGSDCSIVADLVTGLEWQRCGVGQTWNVSTQTCGGDPDSFTPDQALTLTAPGGFRLPTIEELRSLVYCSNTGAIGMYAKWPVYCGGTDEGSGTWEDYQQPTIVHEAFPNTRWWYWSSSSGANDPSDPWYGYLWDFWYVDFYAGSVAAPHKQYYPHARLVRGGQSLAFLPSALATHQDPLLSPKAAPVLLSSELPSALRSVISDAQATLSSPQASVDGRVIVFATDAALLPEDNNGVSDIYRFTVAKGQLQRLSVGQDGQPANAASHSPRIDASGQRVVFLSAATNLTPGLPGAADQLYLHDEQIGGLLRLSETPSGEPADAAITHPLIDAAGQQVVYRSAAHNLADGPGLYRYDLRSGLRQPIAVDEQGQPDLRADVPAADAALALIAYQRPPANGLGAESTQVYLYDSAKSAALPVSEFFDSYGQPVTGCCASVSPDGGYLAWRETTAAGERHLVLMERASGRRNTQPWPQVEALAEQAPVFRNDNRELWWVAPLQGPGSEPVLQRMLNPLMEAAR